MADEDAFKLSVEIPVKLNEQLDRFARRQKMSKTDVTVWALRRLLAPPEGPNG